MTLIDGYFMMPLTIFVTTFSSFVAPIIESLLGIKLTALISITFLTIGNLIILLSTKLVNIYIAMCFLGTAGGIGLMPLQRNCWYYFPQSRGKVSGFILLGYGSSSFFFTSLADYIINPSFIPANTDGYFNPEIASNTKRFITTLNYIFWIVSFIAFCGIFEYKHQQSTEQSVQKSTSQEDEGEVKDPVKQAFTHPSIWLITLMNFSTITPGLLSANTYRTFGQLNNVDVHLLSILSKVFAILNGTGRLLWGLLFDYFSFKSLYYVILTGNLIIGFTLYDAVKYDYVYFMLVSMQALCVAGSVSMTIPLYPKIFGVKHSKMIIALSGLLGGTNALVVPFLTKAVVHKREDYLTLYRIGMGFTLFSFGLTFVFKEKRFKFRTIQEDKGEELVDKSTEKV